MSELNLPEFYQPKSLRPVKPKKRKRTRYGCGYEEGKESVAFFAGPYPDLEQALNSYPDDLTEAKAVIVRFNKDGTDEPIYRWSCLRRRWELIHG